jgi:hypothetical protein
MRPLITIKNKPNDMSVIGIVRIVKIGFTIAFIKANTSATNSEVVNVSTLTPGKRFETINTATAVTIILMKKFIFEN